MHFTQFEFSLRLPSGSECLALSANCDEPSNQLKNKPKKSILFSLFEFSHNAALLFYSETFPYFSCFQGTIYIRGTISVVFAFCGPPITKKVSKRCQKTIKKLSKTKKYQKTVKNVSKNHQIQKRVKNISNFFQEDVKNLSNFKKVSKRCQTCLQKGVKNLSNFQFW